MKTSKPTWWLLYLTVPVVIGLIFYIHRLGLNPELEKVLGIAALIGGFLWIQFWMRANEGAIIQEEYRKERRRERRFLLKPALRSHPLPREINPRPREREPLPRTGFGSARNKPTTVYSHQLVSHDHARIQREVVDLRVDTTRDY